MLNSAFGSPKASLLNGLPGPSDKGSLLTKMTLGLDSLYNGLREKKEAPEGTPFLGSV